MLELKKVNASSFWATIDVYSIDASIITPVSQRSGNFSIVDLQNLGQCKVAKGCRIVGQIEGSAEFGT